MFRKSYLIENYKSSIEQTIDELEKIYLNVISGILTFAPPVEEEAFRERYSSLYKLLSLDEKKIAEIAETMYSIQKTGVYRKSNVFSSHEIFEIVFSFCFPAISTSAKIIHSKKDNIRSNIYISTPFKRKRRYLVKDIYNANSGNKKNFFTMLVAYNRNDLIHITSKNYDESFGEFYGRGKLKEDNFQNLCTKHIARTWDGDFSKAIEDKVAHEIVNRENVDFYRESAIFADYLRSNYFCYNNENSAHNVSNAGNCSQ